MSRFLQAGFLGHSAGHIRRRHSTGMPKGGRGAHLGRRWAGCWTRPCGFAAPAIPRGAAPQTRPDRCAAWAWPAWLAWPAGFAGFARPRWYARGEWLSASARSARPSGPPAAASPARLQAGTCLLNSCLHTAPVNKHQSKSKQHTIHNKQLNDQAPCAAHEHVPALYAAPLIIMPQTASPAHAKRLGLPHSQQMLAHGAHLGRHADSLKCPGQRNSTRHLTSLHVY